MHRTFTLPSSVFFFPCREDSKQRVWAVNKFPPPTHTAHTHTRTCTHSGCIWAKRAFWNHKHLSYHMIAFHTSRTWLTGGLGGALTPQRKPSMLQLQREQLSTSVRGIWTRVEKKKKQGRSAGWTPRVSRLARCRSLLPTLKLWSMMLFCF